MAPRRLLLFITKTLLLLCSVGGVTATITSESSCQKILLPGYFYPSMWNEANAWYKMSAAQGGVVIFNPFNGPTESVIQDYVEAIAEADSQGVTVIGYVYTSYGGRHEADVKADIDAYYAQYGASVGGVFFDETPTSADFLAYYKNISDYVYSMNSNNLVVFNPGYFPDEGYISMANITVIFEGSFESYTSDMWSTNQPYYPYVFEYPADKFSHMIYAASTEAELYQALSLSYQRNAGYVYVTNDILTNPWDTLPPYWEEQGAMVSIVCNNCDQNLTRHALSWIKTQQKFLPAFGFVESFEASDTEAAWATNTAYSYDQAVAVISLLLYATDNVTTQAILIPEIFNDSNDGERTALSFAESILDSVAGGLADLGTSQYFYYNTTGSSITPRPILGVPFSWTGNTGEASSSPMRSGNAAWVAQAFGMYALLTGNVQKYNTSLTGICNWLLDRLAESDTNNCVTGGEDVSWCSTEHNIDAYFALHLAGRVTGDDLYTLAALNISQQALSTSLWNSAQQRFNQGYGDTYRALDVNSWGAIWLTNAAAGSIDTNTVDIDARATSALSFTESTFLNYQESILSSTMAKGYGPYADSSNSFQANAVWSEGTLGVALSYLRRGNIEKMRSIVNDVTYRGYNGYNATLLTENGSLLYAASEVVVNNGGDVFYPYPSVAGTGWLVMTCSAHQEYFWNAKSEIYDSAQGKLNAAQVVDEPTVVPSLEPTAFPSFGPSTTPSFEPTAVPSFEHTVTPSFQPTVAPSFETSTTPSFEPNAIPSCEPTATSSFQPTVGPSFQPSIVPSFEPNAIPSCEPTATPSFQPTVGPSFQPSIVPSFEPSSVPSCQSSAVPSFPLLKPTVVPSFEPTAFPLFDPSTTPSFRPSAVPLSNHPTCEPTVDSSFEPTTVPQPQTAPSFIPTTTAADTSGAAEASLPNRESTGLLGIIISTVMILMILV